MDANWCDHHAGHKSGGHLFSALWSSLCLWSLTPLLLQLTRESSKSRLSIRCQRTCQTTKPRCLVHSGGMATRAALPWLVMSSSQISLSAYNQTSLHHLLWALCTHSEQHTPGTLHLYLPLAVLLILPTQFWPSSSQLYTQQMCCSTSLWRSTAMESWSRTCAALQPTMLSGGCGWIW